jgi:hypothetical protein
VSGFQLIFKAREWIKLCVHQLLEHRILACSLALSLPLLFTPFIQGRHKTLGYELWVDIGEKRDRGGGPVLEDLVNGAGYA